MNAKDIFLQAIGITDPTERPDFIRSACAGNIELQKVVEKLVAEYESNEDVASVGGTLIPTDSMQPSSGADPVSANSDSGVADGTLILGETNNENSERIPQHHAADFKTDQTSGEKEVTSEEAVVSDSANEIRFLPGTKIANRYRIVSQLGRGGMGEVFRADDLRLGQTVALKFLPSEWAQDEKRLDYLHSEVRLSRQIAHPNVCRVFDIGEFDGQHFLSMEYIDGEDLESLLHRIGRLPEDKGIEIARQLCAGLNAAHVKGVLHRDLKPANIMIDGQGQVRITDFGLAVIQSTGDNVIGMSGTPAYMAPEHLLHAESNMQTDIYSLGLILYEIFTGKPAHTATTLAELRALHENSSQPADPSDSLPEISPAVNRAIMRCLSPNPKGRPRSVGEISASLPGADPLAAALAAGETPAPELVAAAGSDERCTPRFVRLCLTAIVVGIFSALFVAEKTQLVNRLPELLSPEALTYRSQEILTHLGYQRPEFTSAIASGFDRESMQQRESNRWKNEEQAASPRLGFWYREADREFRSEVMGLRFEVTGPAQVSNQVPAWTEPGMRGVRLDAKGMLNWFRALSERTIRDDSSTSTPSWSEWFPEEFVGFRLSDLQEKESKWLPSVLFDQVQTWSGTLPNKKVKVDVVAASFQGAPVYFEIIPQGKDSLEHQVRDDQYAGLKFGFAVMTITGLIALYLAGRNIVVGRWDRRGVKRLAIFLCSTMIASNLLRAYHVTSLWERSVILLCLAAAFVTCFELIVYYISFEPIVRRWWPRLLVSWARLLEGRVADPLVGADILLGVSLGLLSGTITQIPNLFYDRVSALAVDPQLLIGPGAAIGCAVYQFYWTTYLVLIMTIVITVVRNVTRSQRIAWIVVGVVLTVFHALLIEIPAELWPIIVIADGVLLFSLVRFGLLCAVVTAFISNVIVAFPMSTSPSDFWFANGMIGIFIVAVAAIYGALLATGQKWLRFGY